MHGENLKLRTLSNFYSSTFGIIIRGEWYSGRCRAHGITEMCTEKFWKVAWREHVETEQYLNET